MAAYAALVSLINNIDQIIAHPRFSKCFDGEQIHSLLQNASSLLEFIEGGSNHEDLEREITSAAHAAEDVVESHVVDQIHAKTLCSLDLQQVIQSMGAVAGKAMAVKEKQGVLREKAEQPPPTYPTPHHAGETAMVGLEDELTQLLGSLTDHRSDRHVISIVGMGGTGKTTLAQNLYAHQLVQDHFDIRVWVTISQQYSSEIILSQLLLSCLGKSAEGEVGELGEQLHKTLYGRRYLIVLDDIWGVKVWDIVRNYLPDSGNSSRVVLTTRLSNVASDCGSTCFNLNLLDGDKSWKLFCEKAMFPLKDGPPQLEEVAKEIVKECKGLALSIVVIGGLLLKSPRNLEYWKGILKGLETNDDSKEKQQSLDALSLSYNHLPPHLKPCFLYMGIFREDSRIRASKITRLWVAEGFIKPKGTHVLEHIAEDYLKDLSDRNLVLNLECGFTGKIIFFSIHDLLRDLCIKIAEQQEFFHVRVLNKTQGRTVRRLVCEPKKEETGIALVRSILGPNRYLKYVKHKLLRVFDATENWNSEDVYVNNVNLRYIAHKRLSANICLVWNLQTLIVTQFHAPLVVAPPEIWKIRQLRHFKSPKVYLPDPPPRRYGQDRMEHLQTLMTIVNLRLSEETCEIIPNIKKLHLIYNAEMHGYDDSLIECLRNVDRFYKLESLDMEIKTSKWPDRDPELNTKLAFPLSLKELCLSNCKLCWEDMSVIGSLPQLQVLRLGTLAVMEGEIWSPEGGQFLRLKFLEIDGCDLRCWDADSSHFPFLEKLFLRELYFLKEIPLEIGEIPTLTLIRVEWCSVSAAISVVKIKKDQLENNDNDALQIEVAVPTRSDKDSFKKKAKKEELELDLFKLTVLN